MLILTRQHLFPYIFMHKLWDTLFFFPSFAKQENPFSSSCRADRPMVGNKSLGFHLTYGDKNIERNFERKERGK
jgi:hypothetical protein